MLCERCKGIKLASGRYNTIEYRHSDNYAALERSSRDGCEGCSFFRDMLSRSMSRLGSRDCALPDETQEIIIASTGTESDLRYLDVHVKDVRPESMMRLDPFLLRAENTWDTRITGRDIGQDVGSGQSLAWIQECLRQCSDHSGQHVKCVNTPDQDAELPLRLLDLAGSNEESDVSIKVNAEGHLRGQYAALSHRWGNRVPLTLTTDKIEAYQTNIPWDSLPVGFQDAVRLCRRLSIRYLWIDSLCILQDSASDWAAQSMRMADVYSNAYVVLAHSSAWDSTDRVLKQREPERSLRLSGENSHIHLRSEYEESLQSFFNGTEAGSYGYERYRRTFRATTKDVATLGSRGWALQERLLARRIIFFTLCQLAWQCRSCKLIESCAVPSQTYWTVLDLVLDDYVTPDTALEAWKNVIRMYSTLDLTYDTDKLVALAGLAQRFKSSIFDTYIAGLWRSFLPDLLSWRASISSTLSLCTDKTRRCSGKYRAPSWSWASIDRPIEFPTKTSSGTIMVSPNQLQILDVYVETAGGSSEFGPVKDAWLQVKGYCMPVTRVEKFYTLYHPNDTLNSAGSLHVRDIRWDTSHTDELWEEHQNIASRVRNGEIKSVWIGPSLLTLQLTRCINDQGLIWMFCLLLAKVDGRVNTYRRVGIIEVREQKEEELHLWEEKELILI